jgi:hypothetical protein
VIYNRCITSFIKFSSIFILNKAKRKNIRNKLLNTYVLKVNVLAIKEREKAKIKVGILGTSNSVMKDGYTVSLQNNPDIVIRKNASIGSSHAALIPYTFSKHDFNDCDVVVLDILANEQYALWLHDYDISLSLQIFDYFLTVCAVSHVLPVILLVPERIGYRSPKDPKFQQIRRRYIEVCNKRGIPYFDGDAYIKNVYTKTHFSKLFQDDVHIMPLYAQEVGSILAKSIATIYSSHKIINEELNIYDFKYINVIGGNTESKNIVERKTSIVECKFLKLSAGETCDVNVGEYEIVGIAFNMAQTNGILEFKGGDLNYKMLSNAYFDPNRSLWLVIWSLLKPIKSNIDGKVRLKCLERADILNMELHDHGKIKEEYSDEPVRIEIQGLIVRSKEMHKAIGMRVGINLDMEKY